MAEKRSARPAARAAARSKSPDLRALRSLSTKSESSPPVDRLIHERVRLAIVSALAVHDALTFKELKDMLDISDGNLSVHARKLEEAQYVSCTKAFDGRVPRTEFRLTTAGRRALERYLAHMEAVIRAVRER